MCDIILASETVKFGLPEITIGTIPGAGGTQRLIKEIGKSKAMEMVLTGQFIDAKMAQKLNLVSHVYPVDELMEQSFKLAKQINKFSRFNDS